MSQPIPTVSIADITRIIRRDFAASEFSAVEAILSKYGKASWHNEVLRVQAAILKLSEGRVTDLDKWCEIACTDYRDVLAAAEYSRYMRSVPPGADRTLKADLASNSDWFDYNTWFNRK